MKIQNSDANTLIAALQSDLPSAEDDARMRARLAAAGVACLGASTVIGAAALTAGSTNAAAASATVGVGVAKGASAVAGFNGGGLLATVLGALPLTGGVGVKVLIAASVIVAGTSYPFIAPKLMAALDARGKTEQPVERVQPVAAVAVQGAAAPVHRADAPFHDVAASVPEHNSAAGAAQLQVPVAHRIGAEPNLAEPSGGLTKPGNLAAERVAVEAVAVVEPVSVALARRTHKPTPRPTELGENEPKSSPRAVQQTNASKASSVIGAGETQTGVLAEETLLIERALRAQRAGDVASARSWLAVHRQRFPAGKLTIDRNRMWAQLQD